MSCNDYETVKQRNAILLGPWMGKWGKPLGRIRRNWTSTLQDIDNEVRISMRHDYEHTSKLHLHVVHRSECCSEQETNSLSQV